MGRSRRGQAEGEAVAVRAKAAGLESAVPLRPVSLYEPAAAWGMSAGQPFFDSFPSQVTVTENDWLGWMVWTCWAPPGLQSSDDQTRAEPEVITSSFCAAPMSRRHGLLEVFWIRIRRRGVDPTGYDAASVETVTAMSLSRQSGTAVDDALGEAVLLGVTDGEVEGDAEVGLVVGEAVVEGLCDGEAAGESDPPKSRWPTQRSPSTRATTTSTASRRRTQ